MALIECPECKQEVFDQATACPICGAPMRAGLTGSSTGRQCPECRSTVDPSATRCPNCRQLLGLRRSVNTVGKVVFALALLGVVLVVFGFCAFAGLVAL